MLDLAEIVVINKFDKRGAPDALRDVRKQWRRNHVAFELADEEIPVYPTIASQFNDPGLTWMFVNLCRRSASCPAATPSAGTRSCEPRPHEPLGNVLIPGSRVRYLAEIAEQGRGINERVERQAEPPRARSTATRRCGRWRIRRCPARSSPTARRSAELESRRGAAGAAARPLQRGARGARPRGARAAARLGRQIEAITAETYSYTVRGREVTGENYRTLAEPPADPEDRAAAARRLGRPPALPDEGEPARRLSVHRRRVPLPARGRGPDADVRRRGDPGAHQPPLPLSLGGPAGGAAVDRVRLGDAVRRGPAERPDIYGKVGNSGVSIATVDDAKKLYSGFDLCAPTTSVSMTINGPAPIILAFFMNAAIDQQVERHLRETGGWERGQAAARGVLRRARRPADVRRRAARRQRRPRARAARRLRATWSSSPRSTSGSRPRPCAASAAPSRPTSSRRTRRRTRASSRPSSR